MVLEGLVDYSQVIITPQDQINTFGEFCANLVNLFIKVTKTSE